MQVGLRRVSMHARMSSACVRVGARACVRARQFTVRAGVFSADLACHRLTCIRTERTAQCGA